MQARRGVLFLTAGSVLCVRRNVGKNKRTKYCVAYKPYFKVRGEYKNFSPPSTVYVIYIILQVLKATPLRQGCCTWLKDALQFGIYPYRLQQARYIK